MIISRSLLLGMRNFSNKFCRENQITHFMLNNFFLKLCYLRDNVEKCSTGGQAKDDNMAHAYCMLDN